MARNAKLDLAKRQAVGINRAVPTYAVGTAHDLEFSKTIRNYAGQFIDPAYSKAGEAIKSTLGLKGRNDRRVVEGEKPIFTQGKAEPFDVTGCKVTVLEPGTAKGADGLNHKTSRATPQSRGHMNTFAGRTRQWSVEIPNAWKGEVHQTLIPRTTT